VNPASPTRAQQRAADLSKLLATPGAFAPAEPGTHRLSLDAPSASRPPLPLLVDVTPLSLSVETVGGYRDVIIPRNSPVPCEQARTFVTSQHGQTTVLVRVGQGEAERFEGDTLLGELELSGIRAAPRGEAHVVVTFALDTDGMLEVRAADAETGHTATARLRLVGLPEAAEVARMSERHARRGAG
jgi:molecular chaperone DnaK